jgi:hypothetical protein
VRHSNDFLLKQAFERALTRRPTSEAKFPHDVVELAAGDLHGAGDLLAGTGLLYNMDKRAGPGRAGPGRAGPGRAGPGRAGPGRAGPYVVELHI